MLDVLPGFFAPKKYGHVVVETGVRLLSSFCSIAMTTSPFLDSYEPLDVIGSGSFGINHKMRGKTDGLVRAIGGTSVFPDSQLFSQIFAHKGLDFERLSERDTKQIVAEVCVLIDSCNFTID